MKYKELKERYKHRFSIRMAAGFLCVALAGGSFGAWQLQAGRIAAVHSDIEEEDRAAKAEDTDTQKKLADQLVSVLDADTAQSLDAKEETVYLITDANGKVNQTIVSNWLKNGSANAQILDETELVDIENVKGEETFTQNGRQITWQADGQDIYYRGTTTKEMPISEQVTYYLDGKEIAPEELGGKSGKVTIRFDYTNHARTVAKIDGRQADIYVPFTVVSGMILNDGFRNVRVNNGRVLSDGNRMIAIGIAMPGLKESLDIDENDFDKDFEFTENDIVIFVTATGRSMKSYMPKLKPKNICVADLVLITQNIKYTNYDNVCADYVIHVLGKFDGIQFNYQTMMILDILRIRYYQKYYL